MYVAVPLYTNYVICDNESLNVLECMWRQSANKNPCQCDISLFPERKSKMTDSKSSNNFIVKL